MSIEKDIPELIKAGIITPETAQQIQEYYKIKSGSTSNRLFIVFGILGAILVGLGIILIIAHNWDELSKFSKTIFAFFPLVAAQSLCLYVLLRKPKSSAWRESATVLLFFAVGACISLISQIYHIPGNLSSFLLIWMLLCLPLMYVMKSSMAALIYILGITYYAAETGYFSYPTSSPYIYWLLYLAVLPQYFSLFRKNPRSNFITVENWLLPISVTIALGTLSGNAANLMFLAYFSLFSFFYIIGNNDLFSDKSLRNNSYKTIGSLGILILLFTFSFDGFWSDLRERLDYSGLMLTSEFWIALAITLAATGYLVFQQKNKSWREIPILSSIFIPVIIIFIIGFYSSVAVVLINIIILMVSILIIIQGTNKNHLGILNLGLSIITIWIIIRFLNTDLSFIIRGLLLMAIGVGFFSANYWMLKKRRKNEQ
jgi:uncharacterized membrane protein